MEKRLALCVGLVITVGCGQLQPEVERSSTVETALRRSPSYAEIRGWGAVPEWVFDDQENGYLEVMIGENHDTHFRRVRNLRIYPDGLILREAEPGSLDDRWEVDALPERP